MAILGEKGVGLRASVLDGVDLSALSASMLAARNNTSMSAGSALSDPFCSSKNQKSSPKRTSANVAAKLSAVVDASPAARLLARRHLSWKGDSGANVPNCPLCGAKFSMLRRRHHCRMCGQLGCGSCTNNFIGKTRLCDECHLELYLKKDGDEANENGGAYETGSKALEAHPRSSTSMQSCSISAESSASMGENTASQDHLATNVDWLGIKDSIALVSTAETVAEQCATLVGKQLKKSLASSLKTAQCDLKQLEALVAKLKGDAKWSPAKLLSSSPSEPSDVDDLSKRLEKTRAAVESAKLETYFPKTLGWKWRFKLDEGLYMGAKSIALDQLRGNFDVSVRDGLVRFSVTKGVACIRAYHLKARGVSGTLLRLIRNVLSREEVYIKVHVECVVSVKWNPAGSGKKKAKHPKGYWEAIMGSGNTHFKVKIEKRLGGIPLPNALLVYLCESFLPKLIASLVADSIPVELGPLVGTPDGVKGVLPKECCARLRLCGSYDIQGTIPEKLWNAPLDKRGDADSETVRNILGITLSQARTLKLCSRKVFDARDDYARTKKVTSSLPKHTVVGFTDIIGGIRISRSAVYRAQCSHAGGFLSTESGQHGRGELTLKTLLTYYLKYSIHSRLWQDLLSVWNKSLNFTRDTWDKKIGEDNDEVRLAAQRAAEICVPDSRQRGRARGADELEPQWFFRMWEEVEAIARCRTKVELTLADLHVSFDLHLLADCIFSLAQITTKADMLQKCLDDYAAESSRRRKNRSRRKKERLKRKEQAALRESEEQIVASMAEKRYAKFGRNLQIAQYWTFWAFDIAKELDFSLSSLQIIGGEDPRDAYMYAMVKGLRAACDAPSFVDINIEQPGPSPKLRLVGRDYTCHSYSKAIGSHAQNEDFLYTIELKYKDEKGEDFRPMSIHTAGVTAELFTPRAGSSAVARVSIAAVEAPLAIGRFLSACAAEQYESLDDIMGEIVAPILFKDEHEFRLEMTGLRIAVHRAPADDLPDTLFGDTKGLARVYRDKNRGTDTGNWTKEYNLRSPDFHLLGTFEAHEKAAALKLSFLVDLQQIADEFC